MSDGELAGFSQKFPKLTAALEDSQRFPLHTFRDYERILVRLEALWGTMDGHEYLEDLMMTQRPDRQGFNDIVATELIRLHLLHLKQYPEHLHSPHDPFAQIA